MDDEQLDALAAAADATGGVATGPAGAGRVGDADRLGAVPLAAQVPELRRQLEHARDSLERLAGIDADLHERVSGRFADLAGRAETALGDLAASVRRTGATAEAWEQLRETRTLCTSLFDEVLAFVEGALVRANEIDAGVCAVADALLDQLSDRTRIPWRRLTILAEREFLGEVGEIVRLRFPELSAWSLPIAVHEFGHFVGPELRRERDVDGLRLVERPFQDLLLRELAGTPGDSTRARHLHEYFGDLFATYAAGPAYPFACLVLRFDPGRPRAGGGGHPPPERRVLLMLKTLAALDEEAGLAVSYSRVMDQLRGLWDAGRAAAGEAGEPGDKAREEVERVFGELYPLVKGLGDARYTGFHRARALAERLDEPLRPGDELPDVLNAAWVARIAHGEGDPVWTEDVGLRALELCREAIAS